MRARARRVTAGIVGAALAPALVGGSPAGAQTPPGQTTVDPGQTTVDPGQTSVDPPGRARLNLVLVLDGLRPDSVNAEDTPNILRLRESGVNFVNSHAAVPTVTRGNSAAIGTGSNPGTSGILGNSLYVAAVDPEAAFSTGDARNLTRLDEVSGGRVVFTPTLGERLEASGRKLAAVGSGSTGSTLLLNPRAPRGVGYMVNGDDPASGFPLAFPPALGDEILRRFGPPPAKSANASNDASVDWAEQVLRDYVLPELRPSVMFNWFTEPDGTQHRTGAGSPESRATIRNDDRQVGLLLERLGELGLADETNIFVISDHGFSVFDQNVNVAQELTDAGLKAGPRSDDVVVSNSGSVLLHVRDRDPERIQAITEFLQRQSWSDALYTAAERPRDGRYSVSPGRGGGGVEPLGWVDGTFSLELIHQANAERGADIVLTFPWSSRRNAFGVPGTSGNAGGGATGPRTGNASGHGSFSPWDIRNTMIAWGVDVRDGVTVRAPAGNVDVAPTIAALTGLGDERAFDGRVLREALEGGEDEERLEVRTRTFRTTAPGGYRAAIQTSHVAGRRYVDKSWRTR